MANNMAESLQTKLCAFVENLDIHEQDNYRLLLCRAAGLLAPFEDDTRTPTKDSAFLAVVKALSELVPAQLLWQGRLSFLDLRMLAELREEARVGRDGVTRFDRHSIKVGGPTADRLACSDQLRAAVNELVPLVYATGVASYVYYLKEGDGLEPHVDTEIFSVNVLIMLDHQFVNEPSALIVYRPTGEARRILLEPGDVLIMDAAGLVHGRESMKAGESMVVLTIGFKPENLYQRSTK